MDRVTGTVTAIQYRKINRNIDVSFIYSVYGNRCLLYQFVKTIDIHLSTIPEPLANIWGRGQMGKENLLRVPNFQEEHFCDNYKFG